MAAQYVTIDRETLMLLPPDLREWVPDDSMVHFIIDAVESLDIQGFCINERGSGSPQYPPSMMLARLVYSYATGRFSSREIEQLMRKAEDADSVPLDTGLCIPEEIRRREDRKAKLLEARKVIEERYADVRAQKQEDYDEKKKARDDQRSNGKKPRGRDPEPPSETPPDKAQFNFTDGESRIMKAGNGEHVQQAFNAQAVIDTEGSMLILGEYVTNHANDKRELVPAVACVAPEVRQPSTVCADTGYFSENAVTTIEGTEKAPLIYCAIERLGHHRTVSDLERKALPEAPAETATVKGKMAYRLKTPEGHRQYKKRKETIEPAFGIIKSRLGFRQFLMRGLQKVGIEWNLVTLAYNMKRLQKIGGYPSVPMQVWLTSEKVIVAVQVDFFVAASFLNEKPEHPRKNIIQRPVITGKH